jgi:hypothetical protein
VVMTRAGAPLTTGQTVTWATSSISRSTALSSQPPATRKKRSTK